MTDTITLPREVAKRILRNIEIGNKLSAGIEMRREIEAALEQPQDHPEQNLNMVPEGWKLVPVEPADSQIRAAQDTWWHACNCETYWDQIYAAMLAAAPQPPTAEKSSGVEQPQGEPPGSTESAYQRGYLDGMAKGRRDAAMDAEEGQEPVTARHRFRNPQRGTPDWSVWQPCKVEKKRPVWEIDSQGFEVEYQALYTHPQPKREPLTDAQINDHRLALPYDGEDLPDPWDFKQGVRAAERAHRIGGEA